MKHVLMCFTKERIVAGAVGSGQAGQAITQLLLLGKGYNVLNAIG